MLSANCSLSAMFPLNKTQYNLISDSLCKTLYISEAYHSGKQLYLSFVANLIPVKFGVDPMLSLRAPERRPCSLSYNFGFSATCGGTDCFFFIVSLPLSVFFPLLTKFQIVKSVVFF